MEYSRERSDDLMRAYDEYLASCDYIRMSEVYKAIVNMPSRRFWVSETRAAIVVFQMLKDETCLKKMRQPKREMYEEIYRRVMILRERHPRKTIFELCAMVVIQPAPKFYLAPGSAKIVVHKVRKAWIRRKRQRLRLF